MAASDKPFHNQRTLDIVFAVSNILMLLSVVWMFVQDYNREFKVEQRTFRDVEVAIAQPRGGGSPAPVRGGVSRLHVQYLTQIAVRPPTFVVFTAGGKPGLHFSYERHLQNRLREEFDFFATPLRIFERHKQRAKR